MTPLLPNATVGTTELRVSMLGLGAAPLANLYRPIPEAQAEEIVHHALRAGITFFDTAPRYGNGLSERRLGKILVEYPRESYVLATKVGWELTAEGAVPSFTRDGVRRSLEASLHNLGLERIDIAHIHDPDDHYQAALDEVFPVLAELRGEGVIGAVGAGMNGWQMLVEFAKNADFDCFLLAGRYTLLEQGALEALDLFRKRTIGVFAGGVYNSGILATGPQPEARYDYAEAPPQVMEKAQKLAEVCTRHNVPLKAAAVQFVKAHPAITSLVVGAESPAQLHETLEAWHLSIPSSLWEELRAEGLIDGRAPVPGELP